MGKVAYDFFKGQEFIGSTVDTAVEAIALGITFANGHKHRIDIFKHRGRCVSTISRAWKAVHPNGTVTDDFGSFTN